MRRFCSILPNIVESPTFSPDEFETQRESFVRSAADHPWLFTVSDNCSAQYRSPKHLYQIASRGYKYGHYSIHTFSAPQHGKQQADPAGGSEHAFSKSSEKKGNRLDTHWRLYDHMVRNRPHCSTKTRRHQFSVTKPISRAFIDDAPLDDPTILDEMKLSTFHSSPASSYLRVDSRIIDECTSIPSSSFYSQFASFSLQKYTKEQPIWLREFGCFCDACFVYDFDNCAYKRIVGPWELKYISKDAASELSVVSRASFRKDNNRWKKSIRSPEFGNGVLLAIKGIYDSQEGANHENDSESQESYWLAEARTGVRRAARILDPGNMTGDIIPKGAYFLKVKYYVLHSVGSLKYIEAAMPEAVVDFRNVISCPRLHWDKVFRAQGILGKVYQLHPHTHGIICHLVPLHRSL